MSPRKQAKILLAVVAAGLILVTAGCGPTTPAGKSNDHGRTIRAVGAESQYADVIRQIGGRYVSVSSIMNNPFADPHAYEANTVDAELVAAATLIVQNGSGYDTFMDHLEAASPNPKREVITAAAALGYRGYANNPHLWYRRATMPRVAALVEADLSRMDPAHADYFRRRLVAFDRSLGTWYRILAGIKQSFPGAAVAVTEPVGDYMLQAAGLTIKTPWAFQSAIMNGVDPSPQDMQIQDNLLQQRRVRFFLYNRQVTESVTVSLLQLARKNHVPVVGIDEIMPPKLHYQNWVAGEATAMQRALQKSAGGKTA